MSWGEEEEGPETLEPKKRKLKTRTRDKHGREIPVNPILDIPMKRFRENIDTEKLELFLNQHEKYQVFIAALHDPNYARLSFPTVCRKFNISLHELQTLYTDGMRQLGLLALSNDLPQVMADVGEDAKSRLESCPRCDGDGTVNVTVWDEENDAEVQKQKTCPQCKGAKEVRVVGDKHARDLMFESMKLTKVGGPLIAIQQNYGSEGGSLDSKMEGMLKLTQTLTMGERKEEA